MKLTTQKKIELELTLKEALKFHASKHHSLNIDFNKAIGKISNQVITCIESEST